MAGSFQTKELNNCLSCTGNPNDSQPFWVGGWVDGWRRESEMPWTTSQYPSDLVHSSSKSCQENMLFLLCTYLVLKFITFQKKEFRFQILLKTLGSCACSACICKIMLFFSIKKPKKLLLSLNATYAMHWMQQESVEKHSRWPST